MSQPHIYLDQRTWYETRFQSADEGLNLIINAFPSLYNMEMQRVKDLFDSNELSLIIDAFNNLKLTPQILGQHIIAEITDGIGLEKLDEKWKVDKDKFLEKLNRLSLFDRAILEIWTKAFWDGKREGQETYQKLDLDEYVKELS